MNEVINTIKERRSIRSFRNEQITEEQIDTILEAGSYAPSGMGQQATMMVAVQDPEVIAQMSGLNAQVMGMDIDPFYGAPTVVVVFADSSRLTYVEDGSLVIGSMMLAASSIGVDSCWIHRRQLVLHVERIPHHAELPGLQVLIIHISHQVIFICDQGPFITGGKDPYLFILFQHLKNAAFLP